MLIFTKSKTFLLICLSICAGIGVGPVGIWPWWLCALIIGLAAVLLFVFWPRMIVRIICVCVVLFVCGVFRYQLSGRAPTPEDIDFYNGSATRFLGVVADEPDVRQDSVKLSIETSRTDAENASGRVLVTVPTYPSYHYGDLLEISCEIATPGQIALDDGSGRIFDYEAYLSRYEIHSVCYRPQSVLMRGEGYGSWIMAGLFDIKNRLILAMQEIAAEPFSSLLGGILLGAKKAMPPDLMTGFNRTGITHIVALSGFNITIIAMALSALTQRMALPRRMSFWVSCLCIGIFVVMTGAQASAVRAGIMGGLVLLGRELGRLSRITNVLVFAATCMVVINPRILSFDAGFQLSFLATLGLVYLSPVFERWFSHRLVPGWLSTTLAATMSAIFFTAPLIAYQFGRLSIVAPLVNLLIVPVIPLTMGLGFGAVVLALAWLPLGSVAGWFVGLILRYIVAVTEFFSGFDFASIAFRRMSWIWLVAWYAIMTLGIIFYKHRQKKAA
ncbi:MAG: ComEC/Rec2 family competence protein [Patescibacteria group bacterium]